MHKKSQTLNLTASYAIQYSANKSLRIETKEDNMSNQPTRQQIQYLLHNNQVSLTPFQLWLVCYTFDIDLKNIPKEIADEFQKFEQHFDRCPTNYLWENAIPIPSRQPWTPYDNNVSVLSPHEIRQHNERGTRVRRQFALAMNKVHKRISRQNTSSLLATM